MGEGSRVGVTRTFEWVSFWGCGNRDKQGFDDDDDDDGGTLTGPQIHWNCYSGFKMFLLHFMKYTVYQGDVEYTFEIVDYINFFFCRMMGFGQDLKECR